MYVVDGACSCVSFIARGVAEQKYNPKTGFTPASQRREHQPIISFSSPSLRGGLKTDVAISSSLHCVIARREVPDVAISMLIK